MEVRQGRHEPTLRLCPQHAILQIQLPGKCLNFSKIFIESPKSSFTPGVHITPDTLIISFNINNYENYFTLERTAYDQKKEKSLMKI